MLRLIAAAKEMLVATMKLVGKRFLMVLMVPAKMPLFPQVTIRPNFTGRKKIYMHVLILLLLHVACIIGGMYMLAHITTGDAKNEIFDVLSLGSDVNPLDGKSDLYHL